MATRLENLNNLVIELSNLTLWEASQLAQMLREKWGIREVVTPLMQNPNRLVDEIETKVAKSEFDLILKEAGTRKIDVIKVLRQIRSLGLREAKEMAETPDVIVLSGVMESDGRSALKQLESVGAIAELV